MSKKEIKQPGYSWVSPHLMVSNVDAAIKFYQQAFNFEKKDAMPGPEGDLIHGELSYQGHTLMVGKAGTLDSTTFPPYHTHVPCPMSLYIYCENVDAFYEKAIAMGAKSIKAPEDTFWGDRMCSLQDPEGYIWNFATHTGETDLNKAVI